MMATSRHTAAIVPANNIDYETIKATDHRKRATSGHWKESPVETARIKRALQENAKKQPSSFKVSSSTNSPSKVSLANNGHHHHHHHELHKQQQHLYNQTSSSGSDLLKLNSSQVSTAKTYHSISSARHENHQPLILRTYPQIKQTSQPNNQQISSSHHNDNSNNNKTLQEALVHTDSLNASSAFLFIHPSDSPEEAESGGSKVAILAATFAPNKPYQRPNIAESNQMVSTKGELVAAPSEFLPRLSVLNLEVTSTSATLTWNFGLYPASEEPNDSLERRTITNEPSKSEQSLSRRKRLALVRRDTPRSTSVSSKSMPSEMGNEEEEEEAEEPEIEADTNLNQLKPNKSSQSTSDTSTDELTVSKRLRMSKVQSLPASLTNRRPPARDAAQHSQELTSEPYPSSLAEDAPLTEKEESLLRKSTTSSTTSTTTVRPMLATSTTARARSFIKPIKANRTRSTEAPMIRTPSVLLTRISSQQSKSVTSQPTRREPKALTVGPAYLNNETASIISTSTSTTTLSPISNTTTSTSTPSTTSTASTVSLLNSSVSEGLQPLAQFSSKSTSLATPATTTSPLNQPTMNIESLKTGSENQKRWPSEARDSKWLIRLRRFGSNEIDIVKIVINNGNMERVPDSSARDLSNLRYISFKNLLPSSAYEICVESASPNQQVGDTFQILNANHFLKCHDSSQVELANITSASTERLGLLLLNQLDHLAGQEPDEPPAMALPQVSSNNDEPNRYKSLCREFFTLSTSETLQRINFGLADDGNNSSELIKNQTLTISQANQRRAKSLNNVLRSRVELLEIGPQSNGRAGAGNMWFEMAASRESSSGLPNSRHLSPSIFNLDRAPSEFGDGASSRLGSNGSFYGISLLPLLGCVFGLIFILTLANMILNAISCRQASAASRARRRAAASARMAVGRIGASFNGPGSGLGLQKAPPTPGGFYSDNSDHSGTSKSRMVIVGKSGEPFAATSAYFEIPCEPMSGLQGSQLRNSDLSSTEASSNSPTGTGGGLLRGSRPLGSTSNLITADARFPLGPSFEGDERHNADMVGLARKNYDNFINNVYGTSPNVDLDADQQGSGSRADHHRHRHQHQRKSKQNISTTNLQMSPREHQHTQVALSKPASSLDKPQRIRFDKINPIYNMEALYIAPSSGGKSQSRMKSVSTFGYGAGSQQDLQSYCTSPSSRKWVRCSASIEEVENSPVGLEKNCCCGLSTDEQLINEHQDDEQLNSRSEFECDGQDCDDGSFYTCCLDRQKQRFHKQQQQLEMVMTKSGSLLPQPFISPICPVDVEAPERAIKQESDRDQQEVALEPVSKPSEEAERAPPLSPPPPPPPLQSPTPTEDKEENLNFDSNAKAIDDRRSVTLPVAAEKGAKRASTLIRIQPMADMKNEHSGGGSEKRLSDEAINKDDFEKRRKELGKKLNLVGMSKSASN